MRRTQFALTISLAIAQLLSSCSTEETVDNVTSTTPTYTTLYDSVFKYCADCHSPDGAEDIGIDFSQMQASYDAMYNKTPSEAGATAPTACQSVKLINPGQAQQSILAGTIVASYSGNFDDASCVPSLSIHETENALPSTSLQESVVNWINAGASYN